MLSLNSPCIALLLNTNQCVSWGTILLTPSDESKGKFSIKYNILQAWHSFTASFTHTNANNHRTLLRMTCAHEKVELPAFNLINNRMTKCPR